MTHDLTHIDLFSGIGGFALAARNAGFRTVAFSELDPYASAVLRKHWPGVPNLGDITKADFGPYAGATLLTGGFPCQPFSVAGKREGESDHRYLWPAMLRAIRTTRPNWVLGENVVGFVDMGLERAVSDLAAEGYTARAFIIPACAVGLPQIEGARVWIVGAPNVKRQQEGEDWGRIVDTFFREEELRRQQSKGGPLFPCRGSSRVWLSPFPEVCRGDYGIPGELDRLRGIGNAIVPAIACEILKAIRAIETK